MLTSLAVLGLSACLHRPSEQARARREALRRMPPRPIQVARTTGWAPKRALRARDLSGVELMAGTSSATLELGLFDLPDEPIEDVLADIEPILAQTGTVSFDIPMSEDERVAQWVDYLSTRGSKWYRKWLSRSTRFVPIFWSILDEYGLPKDLIFLSMIESGFSPRAYSWAHASGPWQFMPATGRRFGLEIGFWVDERRDFERATHAAAKYLSRLYNFFEEDWYLAWAAYNAGPGRMRKAIRRTGTRDFWRISRTWHIRKETRHYVPKLLAAAVIAKQPDKYGFGDVQYLSPLKWEVMTVTVATDLQTIAKACEAEKDNLVMLNPELRAGVTPPGRDYGLRVPEGKLEVCENALALLPKGERMTYRYHQVDAKDTLETLAQRYKTAPDTILKFNDIIETQLPDFDELVIPVPLNKAGEVPIIQPPKRRFRGGSYSPDGNRLIMYEVRTGDSLWRVARRFRVSLRKLRLWNGLWKSTRLRVGQRLKIYVGRGGAPSGRRRYRRTRGR